MVEFVEDDGSISNVASEILLWGQFVNTTTVPLDSGNNDSVTLGLQDQTRTFMQFSHWHTTIPRWTKHCVWEGRTNCTHGQLWVVEFECVWEGRTNCTHGQLWVVEFDTVGETAFALPVNYSRTV